MSNLTAPAVSVMEIPSLPPSVAEVSTAIPAFVGYTETGSGVRRISTLLEYRAFFGGPKPQKFTVTIDGSGALVVTAGPTPDSDPHYFLYYAI